MRCFLNMRSDNIRFWKDFGANGYIASGHQYVEENAEVHGDHWHIYCKLCGDTVASEIHPSRIKDIEEIE